MMNNYRWTYDSLSEYNLWINYHYHNIQDNQNRKKKNTEWKILFTRENNFERVNFTYKDNALLISVSNLIYKVGVAVINA